MCESKVVVLRKGGREIAMEAAAHMEIREDSVVCKDIMGQDLVLPNVEIREINFVRHEIVLEERDE